MGEPIAQTHHHQSSRQRRSWLMAVAQPLAGLGSRRPIQQGFACDPSQNRANALSGLLWPERRRSPQRWLMPQARGVAGRANWEESLRRPLI